MVRVKRSMPAPESLEIEKNKASGSYEKTDVVERLRKDFHNKCYICEMDNLQDPQVEHLRPHFNGKNIDLKFDWNNLFWSCGHCNSVKNQRKYDEHVIDCCALDPEVKIYFRLCDGNTNVQAVDPEDEDAKMTAELVTEVFNKTNSGMRVYKSNMRFDELNREMNKLYTILEELSKNERSGFLLKQLQVLISAVYAFAKYGILFRKVSGIKVIPEILKINHVEINHECILYHVHHPNLSHSGLQ